jgi:CCR4-NOT transcription complex subunit 3
MERFKVCERESKTKTFSKEGLSLQATKVDPAQARRNDARDWITATVSTLEEECEAFEAEVESLGGGSGVGGGGDSKGGGGGGGGRRGKAKAIPPRVTHLEASADRHRAHVARLEQLLRLLDNEAIEVEDVEGVRELVDDYLARNQGGSEEAADQASATMTPDEFSEPDDLYEGLLERLDAVEAALPLVPSAVALKAHKGDDKGGGASSSSLATAGSSGSAAGGGSVGGGASSSAASASAAAASKAAAVAAAAKQQLAASGVIRGVTKDDDDDASSKTTVVRRPSTSGTELPSSPTVSRKGGLDALGPLAAGTASAAAPAASAAAAPPPPPRTAAPWAGIAAATAAAAAAASARKGGEEGGAAGGPGSASGTPRASSAGGGGARAAVGATANGPLTGAAPASAPAAATTAAAATPKPSSSSSSSAATAAPQQQQQQQQQQPPPTSSTPSPIVPSAPPAVLQSLLTACAPRSIPTPADSSWSRIPPRRRALNGDGGKAGSADGSASSLTSPSASGDGGAASSGGPIVVPASYPATRLPVLDNPALFERLDTEALFFAFYHQPGTHQQYLAARELKRQSWRYHKAHGAWFQRHEEPRAAGAEFERGTFVYFDYNVVHDDASAGWCYRLKQDFTFTYDQLEDELQP